MAKFWRRKAQQDTRNTQPAAQPAAVPADLAAWAREADVSRLSSQTVREAEDYLNKYRHMNLELSQQMGWRVMAAIEAQVTPSPPPFAQPLDVIATVLALRRKQPGTGLSSPSALLLPSLGYEPHDAHLCRLGWSPVAELTSAHAWRMSVSGLGVSPVSPWSGASRAQIRAQIWFLTIKFLFSATPDSNPLFRPRHIPSLCTVRELCVGAGRCW